MAKARRLTKLRLGEVSLVDAGANQHAHVVLWKRDAGTPPVAKGEGAAVFQAVMGEQEVREQLEAFQEAFYETLDALRSTMWRISEEEGITDKVAAMKDAMAAALAGLPAEIGEEGSEGVGKAAPGSPPGVKDAKGKLASHMAELRGKLKDAKHPRHIGRALGMFMRRSTATVAAMPAGTGPAGDGTPSSTEKALSPGHPPIPVPGDLPPPLPPSGDPSTPGAAPTDPATEPEGAAPAIPAGATDPGSPPRVPVNDAAGDGEGTDEGMTIQGQPVVAAATGATTGQEPAAGGQLVGEVNKAITAGAQPGEATAKGEVVTLTKAQVDAFEKAAAEVASLTKRLETAEQTAAAAVDIAKVERDRRETVELEKRATVEFPHLGKAEEVAKTLRRVLAIPDEAERTRELAMLKQANEGFRLATVEVGKASGGRAEDDPELEVERRAGEMITKGEAKDRPEAIRKLMRNDLELAGRYMQRTH